MVLLLTKLVKDTASVKEQQQATTMVIMVFYLDPTLKMALFSHWIVRNNPTCRMACGQTRGGLHQGA